MSLTNALASNTTLAKLGLSRNRSIGDGGVVAIANALKFNTSLTKLDLRNNRIRDGGAAALGEALKVNTSLTELNLHNNSIADGGASSLLKVLTKYNTTLRYLNLTGNDNSSETLLSTITAFTAANQKGIRLLHAGPELDLSSKIVDAAQAKQVAAELADDAAVTALALNQNYMGHQGCVDIFNASNNNGLFASIELNGNSIGDGGCAAMAKTLRENTVLTKILLNGNGIGPTGAIALAESLQLNTSLRELGLGRNDVGNEGAAAIAKALRCNKTLERLNLEDNDISDRGAVAILNTLKFYNHTLTLQILRRNNDISPARRGELWAVMYNARVFNCSKSSLRNPLEERLIPLVVQALHKNPKKPWLLARRIPAVAGLIFYLVRMAARNDSKL
jgi:NLR family CARD domain-containing protein 3